MSPKRVQAAALMAATVLLSVFFFAPVVSHPKSLALPNVEKPDAYAVCAQQAELNYTNGVATFNNTQFEIFTTCLQNELYPPYNLTGHASLSYDLLGVGSAPFPSHIQFTQGNYSGVVYFDGGELADAYEIFSTQRRVVIDPIGVFDLLNASVGRNGYGVLELNVTVKNIGSAPIGSLEVGATGLALAPTAGGPNTTRDGITWTTLYMDGNCSPYLLPGMTCSFSEPLASTNSTQLHYSVYMAGTVDGTLYFHRQEFEQATPEEGPGQNWMSLFIESANQARTGHPLVENSTLDKFAALRFNTASSQPQISDYQFSRDLYSFFGAGAASGNVEELVLYPGTEAPYNYAAQLQSAPIHWSALMNANFTQYGYYFGKAPYYEVSANCPVTEIPSQGINITQYFEGLGCKVTPLPGANWLVLILSS